MPQLNRRTFFQMLGAAGLTPLLPALPASAAVTTSTGASVSKALWAGIHAKSGSSAAFVKTARSLGLSGAAIEGVSARSVGVRVVARGIAHTGGAVKRPTPQLGQTLKPEAKRLWDTMATQTKEEADTDNAELAAPDTPDSQTS